MSRTRFGNAILQWTDTSHTGTHRTHPLRVRLQNIRPAIRVHSWSRDSLDFSTRETISAGVAHEIVGQVRWDDLPQSLAEVMQAGAEGQTVTYYPDANVPSISYVCYIVNDTSEMAASLEQISGLFREQTIELRLRKTDGSRFGDPVFTDLLFYYRAGQDLNAATYSRASVASFRDTDRTLDVSTASSGTLRDNHWVQDENDLWVPSTLLEGARTNELTRSKALDHADWTKTNASVTADQATGPGGSTDLDELIEDGTASAAHQIQQTVTLTADGTYALSCWGIANANNWVRLQLSNGSNRARAWFSLAAGTVGTSEATGTGTVARAYIEDWTAVAAGLYRCVLVGSVGSSATSIAAIIGLATKDQEVTYNGDGSSSIYVGYAQLEDNVDSASSYIPTTSSSDTRTADNLYFDFTAAPQEMSGYVKIQEQGNIGSSDTVALVHIGSGTAGDDPRLILFWDGGSYNFAHDNGTAVATTPDLSSDPSVGDIVELVFQVAADGSVTLVQSINGGATESETNATAVTFGNAWAGQRLYLNSQGSGNVGMAAFITGPVIAKGVKTMDRMRALARN